MKIPERIKKFFARFIVYCPKTGKIVGFTRPRNWAIVLFPVIGLLSLVWFIVRTVPKPYRAQYPCQKIAAGIGISFLTFLAGTVSSFALFRNLKGLLKRIWKPRVAILCACLSAVLGIAAVFTIDSIFTRPLPVYADWNPIDSPNSPIGVAKGIFPGRVTWAHNGDATADTVTGSWWQPGNTNQAVVRNMFDSSIQSLAGKTSVAQSWDALFRSFNMAKGRGDTGYAAGETVAIKINHVNTGSQTKTGTAIDCSAEVLLALVEQLVAGAGVPQTSIIVYDGGVGTIGSYVYNCVTAVYPSVMFRSGAGAPWGNVQAEQWVDNGITYSSDIITPDADSMRVAKSVWDATYLVNLALLKKHENQTAVTMCGKNHFGSIKACEPIHSGINDQTKGMATYNPLVDLGGHEKIGGKTVLYIIDGLWGSAAIAGSPVKWQSAPFNNDWPSSIFMSQDTVAIDSVGFDFINMEHTLWANGDNYLHEMATADDPPSGVFYDPEADGIRMQSLGVHEHWNNVSDRKYTRNLGTGNGIELLTVMDVSPTAGPTATPPVPTTVPTATPPIGPTAIPTATPTTGPTAAPGTRGDANGNGVIDIVDALLVAQYYVGLNPTGFVAANADANCSGGIDIVDALVIARYYVGLVTELC